MIYTLPVFLSHDKNVLTNLIYHEESILKNWISKFVVFFLLFIVVAIIFFEVSFRFFSPDFFISILDNFGILGVNISFDSLFIMLLVFSLLVSFIVFSVVIVIAKKRFSK
jgi:hypothetical protein